MTQFYLQFFPSCFSSKCVFIGRKIDDRKLDGEMPADHGTGEDMTFANFVDEIGGGANLRSLGHFYR
jgi:hypothetical protein